jgi:hypothetical protein
MSRVGHLLNTTLEVWRAVLVPDVGGGQTETRVLQSTQRARVSQPSSAQRAVGDQNGADITDVVYFEPGADVRRGDELRRPSPSTPAGPVERLDVWAVFEPSAPGTYLRADCRARMHEGET